MAMTLEDAERLFGRSRRRSPLRREGADPWLDERGRARRRIPTWTPLAAAALVGFGVGLTVLGARRATLGVITSLPGDWLQQTTAENRAISVLLDAGSQTPVTQPSRRTLILVRLAYALVRASLRKEWAVYPELAERSNGEARGLAAGQHEIKTRLHALSAVPRGGVAWARSWSGLAERVREQIRDEARILPALRERLTPAANGRLTRLMHRERARLG